VIDVTPHGLVVIEMIPGMTLEKMQTLAEPKLQLAPNWKALAPPEAPGARAAHPLRMRNLVRIYDPLSILL
jgi:hypothetical protein